MEEDSPSFGRHEATAAGGPDIDLLRGTERTAVEVVIAEEAA